LIQRHLDQLHDALIMADIIFVFGRP